MSTALRDTMIEQLTSHTDGIRLWSHMKLRKRNFKVSIIWENLWLLSEIAIVRPATACDGGCAEPDLASLSSSSF